MADAYQDPLIGNYTSKTNLYPLQSALSTAQQAKLAANQQALNASVTGYTNQGNQIVQGTTQGMTYQQPYLQSGQAALNNALGYADGSKTVANDPALQAILREGQRTAEQSASARGGLYSGGHALELQKLAQENTNKYLNDVYQRNIGIANMGQQSANLSSQQQFAQGAQLGSIQSNIGNTQANAALSAGDINADTAINQGKTAVAQSTISGLGAGQILGTGGNSGGAVYADTSSDPWAADRAKTTADYAAKVAAQAPVGVEAANAGLFDTGGGGQTSNLGDGTASGGGGGGGFNFGTNTPAAGTGSSNTPAGTPRTSEQNIADVQSQLEKLRQQDAASGGGSSGGSSTWNPSSTPNPALMGGTAGGGGASGDTPNPLQESIDNAKNFVKTANSLDKGNINALLASIEQLQKSDYASVADPKKRETYEKGRTEQINSLMEKLNKYTATGSPD